jgi:rare lipoprotein A
LRYGGAIRFDLSMQYHQRRSPSLTMPLAMLALLLTLAQTAHAGAGTGGTNSSTNHNVKPGETLTGKATYYPNQLNGHKTASGRRFHQSEHTAASNKLPLGTEVQVTNLKNGKSTNVTTTDHGPALGTRKIDLSKRAASDIGLTRKEGKVPVKITVTHPPDGGAAPPEK